MTDTMQIPLDRERLAVTFTKLCEIDSPFQREGKMGAYIKGLFDSLGADSVYEDHSAEATGSESGNIIVRFNGNNQDREPLFFACHLDTVEPGIGVKVVRTGDIFTSKGQTVLGSDDKSGIAAVIELMHVLAETNIDHGPVELIFTTCEEIGLLGVKALERDKLQAKFGYALDSTGIDRVVTGAPAANRLTIQVKGVAAHAGLNPEQGVNALCLAAKAIANLRLGRLDNQSTANFGLIHGGVATNIVPDLITIEGEVRSHSAEKLAAYTDEISATFKKVIAGWAEKNDISSRSPSVDIQVRREYPAINLDADDPVLIRVRQAGACLGREIEFVVAGGGSDANILNGYNLPTAIIATGMDKVHTVDECLDLNHLVRLTELLYALVVC